MKLFRKMTVSILVIALALSGVSLLTLKRVVRAGDEVFITDIQDRWGAFRCLENTIGINTAHNGYQMTIGGVKYSKGVGFHCEADNPTFLEINIEGLTYSHFIAEVGMQSDAGGVFLDWAQAKFSVWVDGINIAKTDACSFNEAARTITANISGGKVLRLEMDKLETYSCDFAEWGNVRLTTKTITALKVSRAPLTVYAKGSAMDVLGAKLDVEYNDGTKETIPLRESMLSGYDPNTVGKQSVKINVGGMQTTLDVFVYETSTDMTEMELASWVVYGARSTDEVPAYTPNKNISGNGTSALCISGREFAKGYGVHPDAGGVPAELTYNIDGLGFEYMTVFAGKDRCCGDQVGMDAVLNGYACAFEVVVDGTVVESSPSMFYGDCYAFSINVKDAKTVTFRTLDVDGIMCDNSSWCAPLLLKNIDPPVHTGDSSIFILCLFVFLSCICSVVFIKRRQEY